MRAQQIAAPIARVTAPPTRAAIKVRNMGALVATVRARDKRLIHVEAADRPEPHHGACDPSQHSDLIRAHDQSLAIQLPIK
jgi:hypothetical protein